MILYIDLNYRRIDFEEIYFQNQNGNYFIGPTTKKSFQYLLISFIILSPFIYHSLTSTSVQPALVIFSLSFSYFLYLYLKNIFVVWEWKKSIDTYLNSLDAISNHRVALTNSSFSVYRDGKETIEKWSNFKKVKIDAKYILLYSSEENYLFPSKSMSNDNFSAFKSIISEKIKH